MQEINSWFFHFEFGEVIYEGCYYATSKLVSSSSATYLQPSEYTCIFDVVIEELGIVDKDDCDLIDSNKEQNLKRVMTCLKEYVEKNLNEFIKE